MEMVYIGRNPCGCITAAAHDTSGFDLADFTRRMTLSGREVDYVPKKHAVDALAQHCLHQDLSNPFYGD